MVALRRNSALPNQRVAVLRVGDLEIDALQRDVRQGTRDVQLSPVEHVLLYTLAAAAGSVVSYSDIAAALGRTNRTVRSNTLARHVSSLRRKLRDDADRPRYIETVLGVGYRCVAPRRA